MRAILLGLVASLFFTVNFVLNRSMALDGGFWGWTASLRFFFMLPMLVALVTLRGSLPGAVAHWRKHWREYTLWGTVGFGFTFSGLCFAASYGEGWLVAGTWQLVIIAGVLLTPLFLFPRYEDGQITWRRGRIPLRGIGWCLVILGGVALLMLNQARSISPQAAALTFFPVLFAAFMYPLGNRKLQAICNDEVDTFQRLMNMTLGSWPYWILLAVYSLWRSGPPPVSQMQQAFLVAVFSGVIATLLLFSATNMVRHQPERLGAVEATQAGELVFAVFGESLVLGAPWPGLMALGGVVLVVLGMVGYNLVPLLRARAKL